MLNITEFRCYEVVKNFSLSFTCVTASGAWALHSIFYMTPENRAVKVFSAYNNNEFEGAAQGKRESNQSEDDDFILSCTIVDFPSWKEFSSRGLPRFGNWGDAEKYFSSCLCQPFSQELSLRVDKVFSPEIFLLKCCAILIFLKVIRKIS